MTPPKRIVAYLVAGAIAVALLFYVFGRIDALMSARDQVISDSSRALLRIHGQLVKYRERLRVVERANQQLAGVAHRRADSLRAALAAGTRVDTVTVLGEIATADSSAFARCSVALLACGQRADSAEAEAGRLHAQLARQLTVRPRRCGVSVGLGASAGQGVGAGATIVVGCQVLRFPWP